jgi:23S rRNA (uracil1939-C5)-methyltransferase
MTVINKIEFIIDHIDPLGQGVFKQDDKIYFIPKTLPGESGTALILKKKKGVHFCEVETLIQKSPKRIENLCPHFNTCNGCHFLHTDYVSELEFKEMSYRRMLQSINYTGDIEVISSSKRLGYRNRIQLHYHRTAQVLGFKDGKTNKIIPVPECKIATDDITGKLQELYSNDAWQGEIEDPKIGHVEIYDSPTGLNKTWNKKYASGGFTQVNNEMNEKMKSYLNAYLKDINPTKTLDLFGGGGNLSEDYKDQRVVLDIYDQKFVRKKSSEFFSLDLHQEDSLSRFMDKYTDASFDTFIIDPPRAGFPHLKDWVEAKSPQNICYISCHPQTMMRDLRKIQELNIYKVTNVVLLDLFPSTFHFEALITLVKIEN